MIAAEGALQERVRSAGAQALERFRLPGLSIAVVHGDALVFCESFGFADIEAQTRMTPDRRQCIASITKTMVGLCAVALVDERRLSLDARVTELLPDVRFVGTGSGAGITVRHLLTHSAGIGEAQTQEMLASTINPDQDARRKPGDFASMYADGCAVEFEPGTKWHYANHGFNLLGEIVSRAEGCDLHDVLARRIFEPLGMKHTDLQGEDHPALATPYHRAPTEDTVEQLTRAGVPVKEESTVDGINIRGKFGGEFNKAALASGGAQSTLPDMALYASALLRRADGIVGREAFETMVAPHYCPDARLTNWGLSFSRTPFGKRTLIGHGGAYFGGWNSHLAVSLDDNVAIVAHMNVMLPDPAPVFRLIDRAVFNSPVPEIARRETASDVLEQAPGTYELTPGRLTNFRPATGIGRIRVERDGDRLRLTSRWGDWKRGVELLPADAADPALLAIKRADDEPALLAFTRDSAGRIDGLRCDRLVRMVRVPD